MPYLSEIRSASSETDSWSGLFAEGLLSAVSSAVVPAAVSAAWLPAGTCGSSGGALSSGFIADAVSALLSRPVCRESSVLVPAAELLSFPGRAVQEESRRLQNRTAVNIITPQGAVIENTDLFILPMFIVYGL